MTMFALPIRSAIPPSADVSALASAETTLMLTKNMNDAPVVAITWSLTPLMT